MARARGNDRRAGTVTVFAAGRCELACATCDCRVPGWSAQRIQRALDGGGRRLVVRGAPQIDGLGADVVRRARAAGFEEVVLRSSGLPFRDQGKALALARTGVTHLVLPLFSHVARVHDRIAGQSGALVGALAAMRALDAAGVGLELEIPLLSPKLQHPAELVDLAARAVPRLGRIQFFVPRFELPLPVAPPAWSDGAPGLAAALTRCRELGVPSTLRATDAIPICALRERHDLLDAFELPRAGRRAQPPHGLEHVTACASCALQASCPGVSISYRRAHGERDIVAWTAAPSAWSTKKSDQIWTTERRRAAKSATNVVLRPTVNCNQDCPFCSANETSRSVWPDPEVMLRRIARAARSGVRRVSFSGGEPTLSRHLVDFVAAARRLGVENIELVTNGTLLDSERKVRALRDAGLTHAFVSLHAHDELLSRSMTAKEGDFARTLRAIQLLVAHGIKTEINHVITARNHAFLEAFVEKVHAELRGSVEISFAFVTPQFKALENFDLVPQLREVLPNLRVALARALELGQPFHIGSRQGIPPCLLRELRPWSDVLQVSREALKEDAPQKVRVPDCDRCRYTNFCTGLWRAYAERYGTAELVPVPGPVIDDAAALCVREHTPAFPRSFEEAHDLVRDREAESELARNVARMRSSARTVVRLPMIAPLRSRPLRLALLGSGRRARRLAEAAHEVRGLSIDAVASPHAPDADLAVVGFCPRYRDAVEALDDARPDAAIIASTTSAHFALAQAALARGIPLLIEKPITRTAEEALALAELWAERRSLIFPAHNLVYAPGLDRIFDRGELRRISFERRVPANAPDAPRSWSRESLFEIVYHAISVVAHRTGALLPAIGASHASGRGRPERVRIELDWPGRSAEIALDFSAATDELSVTGWTERDDLGWRRRARSSTLVSAGRSEPVAGTGSELELMLAAFRDAIVAATPPRVDLAEALAVQRTTHAVIAALEARGAPFERPGAPRHARSRSL